MVASVLRHPYLLIFFVGLAVCLPLLVFGLPYGSHDGVMHYIYLHGFSEQLRAGELYPRWLYAINGGLGGTTFFYYPPAWYYFSSLFAPIADGTWHQLGIASAVAVALSGVTAFEWLRQRFPIDQALVSAVVYMVLPYHLNYDVYTRGALAEAFAFVSMPLILLAADKIVRGSILATVGLGFSIALLLTSHLLTSIMFLSIPFAYVLYFSTKENRFKNFGRSCLGALLGVGLAAAYLFTALTYQGYAQFERFVEGDLHFSNSLIGFGSNGSLKYLAFLALNAMCIAGGVFLYRRAESDERNNLGFWILVLSGSVFMTLYISYPVWALLKPLQMIQFAWRFNTISCLALLPIVAVGLTHVLSRVSPYPVVAALTVFSFCSVIWTDESGRKTWMMWTKLPVSPVSMEFADYAVRLKREYQTMWPRTVPDQMFDLDKSLVSIHDSNREIRPIRLAAGNAEISTERWEARDIRFTVDAASESTVVVSQFFFPGWSATLPESNQALSVVPDSETGLVKVDIPSGKHVVHLKLEKLSREWIGELISVFSFLFSLFFVVIRIFLWPRKL